MRPRQRFVFLDVAISIIIKRRHMVVSFPQCRFPSAKSVAALGHAQEHIGQTPVSPGKQSLNITPVMTFRAHLNSDFCEILSQEFDFLLRFPVATLPLKRRLGFRYKRAY